MIYPNPSQGLVHIWLKENSASAEINFKICNLMGQHLYNARIKDTDSVIDLSSYPAGTYILQADYNGEISVFRIAITR